MFLQGEHYSKLVTEKTDINDSNLAATRPDNGGQGKKVILAILVATLAGAAGIYISGALPVLLMKASAITPAHCYAGVPL